MTPMQTLRLVSRAYPYFVDFVQLGHFLFLLNTQ